MPLDIPLIKVILVEPKGNINLGSVARLCKNFDVNELRLVSPKCNPLDQLSIDMAVKGKDILINANQYKTLKDAVFDCTCIIATCGRKEHSATPLSDPLYALNWMLKRSSKSTVAIVFGREDHGLTNQELNLANKVINIQTSENYKSLNLSHAVSIILYQLHSCIQKTTFTKQEKNISETTSGEIEHFLSDTEELLNDIGFLMEHTTNARMKKIRTLLYRSDITLNELSLLRGVISQTKWALNKQ